MVAIMSGADNGFFYAGQVMHFSSPFTVFLIYHKQDGASLKDTPSNGIIFSDKYDIELYFRKGSCRRCT